MILELPATPGPDHVGGKITIGPDNYLYAVIGDVKHEGKLQINVVKPGFNSGWQQVMGPISKSKVTEDELVNFPNS